MGVEEGFVSIISQVPGFVAYYFIDAGDGVMVSMSVYENQAGADESNELAREWVAENLAALLPHPPQISEGDVVAHGTA